MTNTIQLNVILASDLGFLPDPYHTEWFIHESEPVRFLWQDEGALHFKLVRFEGRVEGPIVSVLSADNLSAAEFRAVIRAFLHG